ncbi:MAG: metallophosphoesterase [Polyangiales bacterium]
MSRHPAEDTDNSVVMRGPGGDDGYDYLLLSDVHLGSDIVPHVRPWAATSWLLQDAEIDARLIALLDHYRDAHPPERRIRLIFVGDFLDLVGVSLTADHDRVRTPPTREEERHGLGSASDHVVRKVEAIAARHPNVFRALHRFVDAGHQLVMVRGNHDIELHWRAAQRALRDAILAFAPAARRDAVARDIRICPWFYAVEGLLYAEHGHEFDAMCSYGDPLLPTCPRDSRRIRSTPFSVLLRHIARPTRGLSSAAYDYVGMGAYARLLRNLGVSGSVRIAVRYARASRRLVSDCFQRARESGERRVQRAQVALRRFAEDTGIAPARLEALRALYVAPAAHSLDFVTRSLYLDRLLSGLVAGGLALSAMLLIQHAGLVSGGLCAIPIALLGGYACIGRGSNTRPQESMQRGAEAIGALFETRWVLMGHTHRPLVASAGERTSYVNLGCWGQDDPPDERLAQHASPCTYFVIRREGDAFVGALLRWDTEAGPQPTAHLPESTPVAFG